VSKSGHMMYFNFPTARFKNKTPTKTLSTQLLSGIKDPKQRRMST